MNKKIILTILTAMFAFCSVALAASTTSIINTAEISFEAAPSTTTSIVFSNYNPVTRVSVNMRKLILAGNIEVDGGAVLQSVTLEYYTKYNPSVIDTTASIKQINANTWSFVTPAAPAAGIPPASPENEDAIYYRIIAVTNDNAKIYFPAISTNVETAALYTTDTGTIATTGGTLIQQSGDQTRGNSNINFANGALSVDNTFYITELYSDSNTTHSQIHSYLSPSNDTRNPIITYYFTPDPNNPTNPMPPLTASPMPTIIMYYGDLPANINNIEVMWLNASGGSISTNKWQSVNFSNDTTNRTVSVSLAQTGTGMGYYAIFDKTQTVITDHRPNVNSILPGQLMYFSSLNPGDTVVIFDMRAKTVRTLVASASNPSQYGAYSCVWDGKDDGGAYVEPDMYLYQIKTGGQVISGVITFVR